MNITCLAIGPESGNVMAFDDDIKQLVLIDPVVVDWINRTLQIVRHIDMNAKNFGNLPMIFDVMRAEERPATQADLDQLMACSMAFGKLMGRIDQGQKEAKHLIAGESLDTLIPPRDKLC